jgi:ABC-type amino acid transport substrate-binding protein
MIPKTRTASTAIAITTMRLIHRDSTPGGGRRPSVRMNAMSRMAGAPLIARCALALGCAALVAGPAAATTASRGTLVVATDATKRPYAFMGTDGHTVRGLDVDLARAVANTLGYRLSVVAAAPGAIASGLASGDYDLGILLPGASAQSATMVRVASARALPGIAVAKGSGIADEVGDALRALVSDGTYRSLLAKWGVRAGT